MKALEVLGRVLFSLILIIFGISHLFQPTGTVGAVPAWLPGDPIIYIYIVGTALVLAGLSFLFKRGVKFSGPLLALLLLIFIVVLHVPGLQTEGSQIAMIMLLKDVGLLGATLTYTGLYANE